MPGTLTCVLKLVQILKNTQNKLPRGDHDVAIQIIERENTKCHGHKITVRHYVGIVTVC